MTKKSIEAVIMDHSHCFGAVVEFNPAGDQLMTLDFTSENKDISEEVVNDTDVFSAWINTKLAECGAKYAIGGYDKHRTIYSRSKHFDTSEEPRRLHLGVDIWGPAGTHIRNFYDAHVHSFNYNDNFGDYGATIILQYDLAGITFHALYGHLDLASIAQLHEGDFIPKGKHFANFGVKEENGFWPPHLHFQVIIDMEGKKGDYPGVCKFSERKTYLENCPDPMLILRQTFSSAMPVNL